MCLQTLFDLVIGNLKKQQTFLASNMVMMSMRGLNRESNYSLIQSTNFMDTEALLREKEKVYQSIKYSTSETSDCTFIVHMI